MKLIITALLFLFSLGLGFWIPSYLSFKNTYAELCEFVGERIYHPKDEIKKWKALCLRRSQLYHPWSSKDDLVKDVRQVLAVLKVSHLELYLPKEVSEVWEGKVEKTGLVSQFVDGELIVQRIHEDSPAEILEIQIGDVILSLDEENPDPLTVLHHGGVLEIQRIGKVEIKPAAYRLSQSPRIKRLSDKWVLIEVPQFSDSDYTGPNDEITNSSEANEDDVIKTKFDFKWARSFSELIRPQDQIILDFRGNLGGTFYAGMHFLSLFLCEPTQVGKLTTQNPKASAVFPLSPQMTEQIQTLMEVGELILETPRSEVCIQNKIQIVTNQETASMAEIVSVVLKEQRQALLHGTSTAGETTIGFWYDYDEIFPGAQLTIPEARFISKQNRDLEGQGLSPDYRLFDKAEHWKLGKDSLIQQIINQN